MKTTVTLLLFLMLVTYSTGAQEDTIKLFNSPRSTVSAAELSRGFASHCPAVHITDNLEGATYKLEAIDNELVRKPYKFALFDSKGDNIFSTETRLLPSAIKDVCNFIQGKPKGK
jgi:hypothetical protein